MRVLGFLFFFICSNFVDAQIDRKDSSAIFNEILNFIDVTQNDEDGGRFRKNYVYLLDIRSNSKDTSSCKVSIRYHYLFSSLTTSYTTFKYLFHYNDFYILANIDSNTIYYDDLGFELLNENKLLEIKEIMLPEYKNVIHFDGHFTSQQTIIFSKNNVTRNYYQYVEEMPNREVFYNKEVLGNIKYRKVNKEDLR